MALALRTASHHRFLTLFTRLPGWTCSFHPICMESSSFDPFSTADSGPFPTFCQCKHCFHQTCLYSSLRTPLFPLSSLFSSICFMHDSSSVPISLPHPQPSQYTSFSSTLHEALLSALSQCPIRKTSSLPTWLRTRKNKKCWDTGRIEIWTHCLFKVPSSRLWEEGWSLQYHTHPICLASSLLIYHVEIYGKGQAKTLNAWSSLGIW